MVGALLSFLLTPHPRPLNRYVTHDPVHRKTTVEFLVPEGCSVDVDLKKIMIAGGTGGIRVLAEGRSIDSPSARSNWLSNAQDTVKGNRLPYTLWLQAIANLRADQKEGVKVEHTAVGNYERDSLAIVKPCKPGQPCYSILYTAEWQSSNEAERDYRPLQEIGDNLVAGFKINFGD
jgi:hypothetical protein